MSTNEFVATAAALFAIPLHESTDGYTARNAPDALSREILGAALHSFEDEAVSATDIPAAISRTLSRVMEQNLAGMRPSTAMAWFDRLSELELEHMAQLYVNSAAAACRTGRLLEVAALRLDGARLARLSRFFGHAGVRDALHAVAPQKIRNFANDSSTRYGGPVPGAALRPRGAGPFAQAPAAGRMALARPPVNTTIEQLYAGFRSRKTGPLAAIFETIAYAGEHLVAAWGPGCYFGSHVTGLMQQYAPDWYRDKFVPSVGAPLDYAHSLVMTTFNYYSAYARSSLAGHGRPIDPPAEGIDAVARRVTGSSSDA